MRIAFVLVFFLFIAPGYAQTPSNVSVVKLNDLQELMASRDVPVKIFNFWATWCAPCVKELPIFEKLNQKIGDHKVYLVNLDLDLDPDPEKVYRFIDRRKLDSQILMLDEQDPNSWIDKIDPQWSGALPATLVINTKTGEKLFVESSLHEEDLQKMIATVQED